jgi:hypothetical protein
MGARKLAVVGRAEAPRVYHIRGSGQEEARFTTATITGEWRFFFFFFISECQRIVEAPKWAQSRSNDKRVGISPWQ